MVQDDFLAGGHDSGLLCPEEGGNEIGKRRRSVCIACLTTLNQCVCQVEGIRQLLASFQVNLPRISKCLGSFPKGVRSLAYSPFCLTSLDYHLNRKPSVNTLTVDNKNSIRKWNDMALSISTPNSIIWNFSLKQSNTFPSSPSSIPASITEINLVKKRSFLNTNTCFNHLRKGRGRLNMKVVECLGLEGRGTCWQFQLAS